VCYGHVPIRDLYEAIGEGFFRIDDRLVQEALQVYFDFGEGFQEEHSKVYRMNRRGVWSIRQDVPLPENVKSLRVDPGYRAGMVHLKELRFDNQQRRASFQLREGAVLGDWLCFTQSDPNMFLQTVPKGAKSLLIDLELYTLDHIPPYDPKPADSVQNDDEKQSQSILQKIAAAVLRSRGS
ncbi:MAG: hypothetical protein LIO94_02920, partial [Clostridiales bacterium]|nr:hypothetical protein [Clostridiales bacterium]